MAWSKHFIYLTVGTVSCLGVLFAMAATGPSGWDLISADRIRENIRILSSDEYEGRAPASKGEALATTFIEDQFKKVGLKPGNPDGTYIQKVPMVGIKADPSAQLVFRSKTNGKVLTAKYADDFVAWTKRAQTTIDVAGDVVFVGYGVVAPEYEWDDFKDVNVKGKIIVVLINDPQVPDPSNPKQLDEKMFKGKAMTYYGRWTYKFEEAAAKGALGCLIVHQTVPAAYPWGVVRSSNTGEQFSLVTADHGMSRCAVEGWITYEEAKAVFALAGNDFDALEKSAVKRDFHPVDLGVTASLGLHNTIRSIESKNIVFSQIETYWGAFLTNFFSFFMIIATAATLFINKVALVSGEQAARAIEPFAGALAGKLFAFGILNAGFMGIVVVSLSTAYAFAEFFGIPGSLNTSFSEGRPFYIIFLGQLLVAAGVVMFPGISLFQLVIATQALNAMMLPLVFYYLISLTNSKVLMHRYVNNVFQKYFSIVATIFITVASFATMAAALLGL